MWCEVIREGDYNHMWYVEKITIYTVWVKKVAPPPKTFCNIFTYGEPI